MKAAITLTPLMVTDGGYKANFYNNGTNLIGKIVAASYDVRHWQIQRVGGGGVSHEITDLHGSVYPTFSAASEALRKAARRLGEAEIFATEKRKVQNPTHLVTHALALASSLDMMPSPLVPSLPVTPAQLAKEVFFEDVLATADVQRVYFLCQQIGVIKIDEEHDSSFVLDESLYGIFFELDALSDEGEGYWESRAECSEAIRECIAAVPDAQEIYSLVARAKENGVGAE